MIHILQNNASLVPVQVYKETLHHRNLQPLIVAPQPIMIFPHVLLYSHLLPAFQHHLPTAWSLASLLSREETSSPQEYHLSRRYYSHYSQKGHKHGPTEHAFSYYQYNMFTKHINIDCHIPISLEKLPKLDTYDGIGNLNEHVNYLGNILDYHQHRSAVKWRLFEQIIWWIYFLVYSL